MSEENQNVAWVESLEELIGCLCGRDNEFYKPECETPGYEKIFPPSKRPTLWFRGEGSISFPLLPRLFRKVDGKCKDPLHPEKAEKEFWNSLWQEEANLIDEFKLRTHHLIQGRLPDNRYQWMVLMQHYETATRLLDWSEEALTAIYFAVENYFKPENHKKDQLPCVWVLKPNLMNVLTVKHILNYTDEQIIEKGLFRLKNFFVFEDGPEERSKNHRLPLNLSKFNINRYSIYDLVPQAVIAPYDNERIKAQAGAFTIYPLFPLRNRPKIKDTYLNNLPESEKFIYKYIITRPERVSEELKQLGVKRSLYFPELPNVSHEIEEMFFLNSSPWSQ